MVRRPVGDVLEYSGQGGMSSGGTGDVDLESVRVRGECGGCPEHLPVATSFQAFVRGLTHGLPLAVLPVL